MSNRGRRQERKREKEKEKYSEKQKAHWPTSERVASYENPGAAEGFTPLCLEFVFLFLFFLLIRRFEHVS